MTYRDETPAAGVGLDADGRRMSGQYRVKDGKELDLTFLAPNSRPSTDSGQLLQQQPAVMGVRLTLNNAEHRGRLRRGRLRRQSRRLRRDRLHQVGYW
ncbi:hypothetical protein [Kutzneria sp. 744]|uniref:hypothetical protein n=1 Tax=Kutzneria sp. (strain 744) TaxID=345341 RepID=UPI0003EEDD2C|nr:hypothetical protein [Kutzneria sp. 744]EWM13252.1 hypothetical protein KUTG_03556 [Kutzneria sp. 744]